MSVVEAGDQTDSEPPQIGMCLAHMSAKKWVKLFWDLAIAAMTKECKQLDDLDASTLRWEYTISSGEKRNALQTIDLIKE